MMVQRRFVGFALAAMLAGAARADAQVNVSVGCSPGIPNCTSLRFFIDAASGVAIDQLFIALLSPPWQFTGGPSSSVGTYSANDSFGPYSGFTTISGGGVLSSIDFFGDNGFPFQTVGNDTGTLDLAALGTGDTSNLFYTVTGVIDGGGSFTVSVTPEPTMLLLMATGLGAVGITRRRRKRVL